MKLLLLTAVLVFASDNFVTFQVCMLNTVGRYTFVPHPTMAPIQIRPSFVGGISDADIRVDRKVSGIKCSIIASAGGTVFVVGSPAEVKAKLERRND